MKRECSTCRFWSELVAAARGRQITALCLSPQAPHAGKMTEGHVTCPAWRDGPFGAVDGPAGAEYHITKETAA